jgi:signal recognition particle subunit SRP54
MPRCARCAARCSRPTWRSRSCAPSPTRCASGVGADVVKSVTPGQMVVKIVHDELVDTLGSEAGHRPQRAVPPVPIMMVGLQGSGKTTTTAKLAKRLVERDKRRC